MMRFIRWIALLVSVFSITACGGSDSASSVLSEDSRPASTMLFDGSRSSLSDFYSESQLVTTESLGFELHFGDEPPVVEGIFRFGPVLLQAASDPEDLFGVGNTDVPFSIVFSGQAIDLLTLDVSIVRDRGDSLIEITDAVISGSGNAFTVFALAVLPAANGLETRMAFSGVLTEFGIENFQYAPFVVGGDNEAVRLFVDQDNLSERLEKLPAAVLTESINGL